MTQNRPSDRNKQRANRTHNPLDSSRLERLALNYVGRFATTRATLAAYLRRKIVERGWTGTQDPEIDAITEHFAKLGYVNDRLMADAAARSMIARGYGPRRLAQVLTKMGVSGGDSETAHQDARDAAWETALAYARRRRLGPYAPSVPTEAERRRAFASLLRAGHDSDIARRLLDLRAENVPDWDNCK